MAEVWTPPPLNDISTSELVTAAYLNGLGNSLRFLKRVAHVEFSSPVSSTATTEATATAVVSAGAITYENVPHMIWFYAPSMNGVASITTRISLFDGTTIVAGRAGALFGASQTPVSVWYPITPTAASHTYNIKVWSGNATTITVQAGTAGTDAYGPGFISIYRVPT